MDQTSENEFQHRPDEGETNDKPGKCTSIKDSILHYAKKIY